MYMHRPRGKLIEYLTTLKLLQYYIWKRNYKMEGTVKCNFTSQSYY